MALIDQIQKDMTTAMKAGEQARLDALRMIKAALMKYKVDQMKPADEQAELQILTTLIKQRREASEMFRAGNRPELRNVSVSLSGTSCELVAGGRGRKAIMEFRVLGPIELWLAGQERDLGPTRARGVLAVLLLTPRTEVLAEALIDRLWIRCAAQGPGESLGLHRPAASVAPAGRGRWRPAGGARPGLRARRRS